MREDARTLLQILGVELAFVAAEIRLAERTEMLNRIAVHIENATAHLERLERKLEKLGANNVDA